MKNRIAILVLRISLGLVFLLFAIGKFRNDIWAQTIRNMEVFQALPWDMDATVMLIGILEAATAAALLLGLFTRWFAGLASLELAGILLLLKFGPVRDIGLLGAAVCLVLIGHDWGGLGQLLARAAKTKRAGPS